MLSLLNKITDNLALTEKDLEEFEKTCKDVWAKYEKIYREKGVLK